MSADHQALIVGGGAAGLSAALVLGRARVDTLLVDAGEPSNLAAPAIGGLLGQHDTAPGSLYAAGRATAGRAAQRDGGRRHRDGTGRGLQRPRWPAAAP